MSPPPTAWAVAVPKPIPHTQTRDADQRVRAVQKFTRFTTTIVHSGRSVSPAPRAQAVQAKRIVENTP